MAPTEPTTPSPAEPSLPGLEAHPHARAVLGPALAPGGGPSHAYMFHGPSGSGKRAVARAFAAALLADGASDPAGVAERVARDSHADLTWVAPSGAREMLVADIEGPVVAAAVHTPFESARRVFVIEAADTMNDEAANRMLKTLEEPPPFVHLLLLTERPADVLPTIASRCLHVRFDPLPSRRIAELLAGVGDPRALACARLSEGDAGLARRLASEEGQALRAAAEQLARAALSGSTESRPWSALLEAGRAAAARAAEQVQERLARELELVPERERRRYEREAIEAGRRSERRARTRTLEAGMRLVELWLRDMLCICEGAPELILAVDRREQLEEDAAGRRGAPLREAVALVGDARLSLALNVAEELALEALAYRLQALLAG